jgi:hypothetical protein
MFGIIANLAKKLWHCDFVEALKCRFCQNHGGTHDSINRSTNPNTHWNIFMMVIWFQNISWINSVIKIYTSVQSNFTTMSSITQNALPFYKIRWYYWSFESIHVFPRNLIAFSPLSSSALNNFWHRTLHRNLRLNIYYTWYKWNRHLGSKIRRLF